MNSWLRRERAGALRQMLNAGASAQDIRQYVNGLADKGTQQSPAGTKTGGARQIIDAAHRANMSVDEYLRQNWDEYEVDGELRPEARRALEMEGGRQYSVKRDTQNRPFVEIDRDILEGVPESERIKTVKNNLSQRFPNGVPVRKDVIKVNSKTRGEITESKYSQWLRDNAPDVYADKFRATDNLDEIVLAARNWKGEGLKHPRTDSIIEFARGDVRLKVGAHDYEADVVVATTKSGEMVLYDIVSMKPTQIAEKNISPTAATTDNNVSLRHRTPERRSDSNVPQGGGDVKTQFSVAREETDSTGRKILRVHTDAYGNVVLPENMSYRIAGEDSPMSDYGHAMFADDPSSYIAAEINLLRGSRGIYAVRHDLLTDINDLKKEIAKRWDEDRDDAFDNAPMITDEYLEGVTGEEIAEEFDPKDIVDSAAAYDNYELTQWFYDRVIEPGEIAGVKTSDGAVVFDDSAIHRVEVEGNRRKGDPDVQYSVAREEIQAIQNIGRKSVNDFSSEDIEKTEAFARRYYQEMGEKSPFFRAWFGDWRANDSTPVQVANERGDARGVQRNEDTGWDVQVSGKVFNESKAHKMTANRDAWDYLPYINDIVKKAVLLDSYTQGKTKSANSLMMHSLYAVADIGNGPELLKLYVEEMNDPNRRGTAKRAYQLQNIERWQPSAKGSGKSLSPVNSTANIETIADLFAAVKSKDSHFNPQPASKIVDEDGRPLVVYHGKGRPPVRGFPLRNKVLKTPPMRQPKALGGREARGEPSGFLFLSNPIHLHQQNRPKWAVLLE